MIELTLENIEDECKTEKPLVIAFTAPWCSGCKAMKPALEEIAEEFEGQVRTGIVTVDEQYQLSQKFDVRSIPALLTVIHREVVSRDLRQLDKQSIENVYKEALVEYGG